MGLIRSIHGVTPCRARADVAAGRTHDLDDALRDLDADAAALEAEDKLPASRIGR